MKKEAFKEESSRTRTDKHFQEAFDHFKPKEVFTLKDDPETIDLSEPDDLSPIATAVREKERKQMIRVFGAYQHFLFYIDVEDIKAKKPWGDHMTNHFMDKLTYYQKINHSGHCDVSTIVTWVQNMTSHNQEDLLDYIMKYHSNKW